VSGANFGANFSPHPDTGALAVDEVCAPVGGNSLKRKLGTREPQLEELVPLSPHLSLHQILTDDILLP